MSPDVRLDPRLARRLAEKKAELERYRPLSPHIVRRLHDDLRVVLTYHSNALEGNTLTLRETQLVIEHGLTVGGHTLREYLEATNHAAAFEQLARLADSATPLTIDTILELHELVMRQILPDAGHWRTVPVSIRGVALVPPPAARVPHLMHEWVGWVNDAAPHYDPIVAATIAHHGFEAVHPFEDGNGRVGRLLLNVLLMRAGYAPALLLRDWRVSYLGGLGPLPPGVCRRAGKRIPAARRPCRADRLQPRAPWLARAAGTAGGGKARRTLVQHGRCGEPVHPRRARRTLSGGASEADHRPLTTDHCRGGEA
jgi:fido (protein-threonine AMPylation protein)